jgi:hypothetical protein
MRHLTIAFAITAAMAFATSFAPSTQAAAGAGGLGLPAANPAVVLAACRGPGPHCPPRSHWVCGPYGHRCWCTPC